MEKTYDAARDFGAMTEKEYAALMIRVVLGSLYLCHPLLMWSIFGLEQAFHYVVSVGLPPQTVYAMAAAELVGGVMLLLGLYSRHVAIGLFPIAIGAGAMHFATDLGAGPTYGAYLVVCLAGQALLASGVFTPQPDSSEQDFAR